jgi:hypothetical protein
LYPLQFPGKQAKPIFGVEVFGDNLAIVADFEDDGLAVPDDWDPVIAFAGQSPNQGTITVRNVGDPERGTGELQEAALDKAERAPGKLNEFNHVVRYRCAT